MPAGAGAHRAATELASDNTFAKAAVARLEHQRRLDAIAEIQAIASSPRVETKRERQIREIAEIAQSAREAKRYDGN